VVLQPYGIYNLLHLSASEFTNHVIPLADLFGRRVMDLEDRVLNAYHLPQIIKTVEEFLLKKAVIVKEMDPVFQESLDMIYRHKGILTI